MTAKISFTKLLEQETECIMVPCVYDCGSAFAAELSGHKAMLLSGGELGESLGGFIEPMLTTDEVVHTVEKICEFSPLPLIVDVEAGFDTPLNAYRTSQRMVAGGAMALLLAYEREMEFSEYKAILKATLAGIEGSDCIVIARKNGMFRTREDVEKGVRDMTEAVELGAAGTMTWPGAGMQRTMELTRELGERLPGWKIYPDQNSDENDIPSVINEEIYPLGYKMISYHYMMKVALAAMWEYGIKNLKNKNNIPSNKVKYPNGASGHSALEIFNMQRYYDLEEQFTGVPHRSPFSSSGVANNNENKGK